MNETEVLVLNGSPGSGKSTIANAIADRRRRMGVAHAVIDFDELGRIYPELDSSLGWNNLRAVWPNYAAIPHLRIILAVCIDTRNDLDALRNAMPKKVITVCELVANASTLKDRVTRRKPNEYWQNKLRNLVGKYVNKDPSDKFGDFRVNTDEKSILDTVQEVLEHLGWRTSKS
jgi:tRNA uridine 5-carbamoylmethylation protein Kti12